jgi:hypothetical protein
LCLLVAKIELYESQIKKASAKKIKLVQFRQETGIKNLNSIKSLGFSSETGKSIQEDFFINTDEILKYVSENDKITYTFKIFPIQEELEQREFYNLVFEKYNNEWN